MGDVPPCAMRTMTGCDMGPWPTAEKASTDKGANALRVLHGDTPLTVVSTFEGDGAPPRRSGAHAGVGCVGFGLRAVLLEVRKVLIGQDVWGGEEVKRGLVLVLVDSAPP